MGGTAGAAVEGMPGTAGNGAGTLAGSVGVIVEGESEIEPVVLGGTVVLGMSLGGVVVLGMSLGGSGIAPVGGTTGAPGVAHGIGAEQQSQAGALQWCDFSFSSRLGREDGPPQVSQPHEGFGAKWALILSRKLAFSQQPQAGAAVAQLEQPCGCTAGKGPSPQPPRATVEDISNKAAFTCKFLLGGIKGTGNCAASSRD